MNEITKLLTLTNDIKLLHKNYSQQYPNLINKCLPQLVIVTKNQSPEKIQKLLINNYRLFGENKIQEAENKWPQLKLIYPQIKLHMIGSLQTNKVAKTIELFDVIESLDRFKLASAIQREIIKQNKHPELYIQINIGQEAQKSGISCLEADDFIQTCKYDMQLNITGVMGIAPADQPAFLYFALLRKIAKRNGLTKISMGMSQDYASAIEFGSTELRIGSTIFN